MARVIRVRPVDGRVVRDDMTGAVIPAEGRLVEDSIYWVRRLRDGDVTIEEDAPAPSAPGGEE